ncbi:bifunctional riboflavin kinase/FAD synthetase [Paenibacillus chitinolyticus]|uniref:bifunctional riboflavin kinase/FAD synthetase n=1 Tax=Paenibacillus chitinolyticus TaxID=79263 RepID=UPI002DB6AD82|nr:bifunctional riboflavin kinase/FAD synthetase [Paenibacillus chitinolyticus]MEC0246133.1 bifunctional riboflavin kinase/FAD synthetase [Paenibacillus chitinolyticus]
MQTIHLSYPIENAELLPLADKKVIAIGDFDGVHLGHREVIQRAVENARELGVPAAIMTFDPHPRELLGQEKYARLLTPTSYKMELFEELGVDCTYVLKFDTALMQASPQQFVDRVLEALGVETVVVGFDFTFGYKGRGTPDTLCELGHGRFAVEVIRPYRMNGAKVSSTAIREALLTGHPPAACELLGRGYGIRGVVVSGDKRGRQLGFPTANLQMSENFLVPASGVYAVRAFVGGSWYRAVMNIGTKPTFHSGEVMSLEVHLLDFDQDIYGSTVFVEFVDYLRPERKFNGIDELITQLKRDVATAEAKFAQIL